MDHTDCATRSSHGFIKLILFLFILSIGAIGFFIYHRYGKIDLTFIERKEPSFVPPANLLGFGSEPVNVEFSVRDEGAGLDEVIVRLEQNDKKQDIFRKSYPSGTATKEDRISFPLSGKEKGLREGVAKLEIAIFDRSFWNNGHTETIEYPVIFGKPRLEVLTGQHNVAVAGTELVFYRIKGSNIAESGVRISDGPTFRGYPASLIDDAFRGQPDVYFAFFALPIDFNKDKQRLSVYAKNSVGNTGTATFYYLVLPKKFKEPDMKLSDDFLRTKFDELLPPYYELAKIPAPAIDFDAMTQDEKIANFKTINETYRAMLQKVIADATSKPEEKRYWDNPFIRPLAAAPTSNFGESRKYSFNGSPAGGSLHAGMDLADTANAVTTAAAAGKVVFAGWLGIYGEAIILDHGFGLTSLYGHLSSIGVEVGETVQKGQQIGRTGATGLAGGDHLHFEIRLSGVPVTPIEWWDTNWIRDHIDNKIQSVKDQLVAQAALDAP